MQVVKDKCLFSQFNQELYQTQPRFITCDQFWDGGIKTNTPLSGKANFYSVAEMMSQIVKEFILSLGEKPLVGQAFCEYERMFAE